MKPLTILLVALASFRTSYSQSTNVITVKAGSSIKETVAPEDLFQYTTFRPGMVSFKDGGLASGKMNYNKLLNEMQFIDAKGDTLALDNEATIQLVRIDADSFYFSKGFVKLIGNYGKVRLAAKEELKVADRLKQGGYGTSNSAAAITNVKLYNYEKQYHSLSIKEDIVLVKVVQYYLGDKYNQYVPANKKNLLDLYSKQEEAVKNYLKENVVDFNSLSDLQKLLRFLE